LIFNFWIVLRLSSKHLWFLCVPTACWDNPPSLFLTSLITEIPALCEEMRYYWFIWRKGKKSLPYTLFLCYFFFFFPVIWLSWCCSRLLKKTFFFSAAYIHLQGMLTDRSKGASNVTCRALFKHSAAEGKVSNAICLLAVLLLHIKSCHLSFGHCITIGYMISSYIIPEYAAFFCLFCILC